MARARRRPKSAGPESGLGLSLTPTEFLVLATARARLDALLRDPSKSKGVVDRLFPPAFPTDAEAEAAHRALLGASMMEARQESLTAFEATLGAARPRGGNVFIELDGAGVDLWLHVLNDFRLLYGTELGIDDDDWTWEGSEDPASAASYGFYWTLTGIQDAVLDALYAD